MTQVVPPSSSGPAADEPTGAGGLPTGGEAFPRDAGALPGDEAVSAAVSRLSGEFSGRVGRRVVVRIVRDCRRELGGSPVGALPELVERLARYRLDRHIG
ncbi:MULTISPECIES: three-helix bundle dimerization domain-containing protein [unclassified Blastococcus]